MKNTFILAIVVLFSYSVSAQVNKSTPRTVEEQLNAEYCSGFFESTDGTIIDVASSNSAVGFNNIFDWLRGRVAGLQVYNSRSGVSIPVLRGGVPAIFIDEMQVNATLVDQLNINDIAIVKIIKTPFYGGFNGGYGAIAIYTHGAEEEDAGSR
jgi:hypothetical protein